MPPIEAVIFDMDGVLIDSEPLHLEATNTILGCFGGGLTPRENESYLGWNEPTYWRALRERFAIAPAVADLMDSKRRVLFELLKTRLPIADGIPEVLAGLSGRGIKMAVASSSELVLIRHILTAGGLMPHFETIASGDDVKRCKPDPEIFLLAAKRIGIPPGRCLVFEDSPHGVAAAHAAGMTCVRVVTSTTRRLTFPPVAAAIEGFVGLDLDRLLAGERSRV